MGETESHSAEWNELKREVSRRVRAIRLELYGEHGGPMLAAAIDVPYRNWVRYESGATMPGPAVLRFLEVTGTNPGWLLTGKGPRFSGQAEQD